jgi:cytochrome c-type biogenesis protein CcmH/NrfF
LPASLRRWNLKLLAAFLISFAALIAQDPTSLLTPGVMRVGGRLACRCGSCRNTVRDCPMLRCSYTEPMRAHIKQLQDNGASDETVVNTIVREQGVVALAAPPAEGWGLFTWIMPGLALLMGFGVYSWWVRRNRREPQTVSEVDRAVLERFRDQIEDELGEPADLGKKTPPRNK